MFNKPIAPEVPTTEQFVWTVVDREPCGKHQAHKGTPCWQIIQSDGMGTGAICNKRARKAGFNHRISEKSLRLSRSPMKKK